MGRRCSQRHAFPRHRVTATLWNRCLVQVEASWGVTLWEMAFPIERMMAMESSANPPRVSATTGMKSTPAERQAERWDASLRWTPTCRAWPGVEAALCKVSCWRGELRAHQVLQGDHGSRWGGVCLPALSGSRGPH